VILTGRVWSRCRPSPRISFVAAFMNVSSSD
jgi:hypothetical protein